PHLGALTRPDLVDPTQQSEESPEYAEEGTLETYHAAFPDDLVPSTTTTGEGVEEGPQGMGSDYSGALWTHETPVGIFSVQPSNDLSWESRSKKKKNKKVKNSASQLQKKMREQMHVEGQRQMIKRLKNKLAGVDSSCGSDRDRDRDRDRDADRMDVGFPNIGKRDRGERERDRDRKKNQF
ncbi:hypothetical protein KIPB_013638, partial [Kipferlia bialata]